MSSSITVPPIPLHDGCFIIDNTTLETGTTCPRAFQFYKLNRRERATKKVALTFGGIIHEALEVRYRAAMLGESVITDDLVERMIQKIREGFADFDPGVDEWRTYDVAVKSILHYAKTYPIEDSEILSVERPFLKPLGSITLHNVNVKHVVTEKNPIEYTKFYDTIEITVLWSGRLDVIYRRGSRIYFRDHKTTSMMGPTYFAEFELSSQFNGYGWACGEEMGELPVGYEVNALGIRKPTRTGVGFEYARQFFTLERRHVDSWVTDTLIAIQTLLSYASLTHFPRHTKHCQGKYGPCQYKIACTLPEPEHQEIMLSTGEFQEVLWSPLNDR